MVTLSKLTFFLLVLFALGCANSGGGGGGGAPVTPDDVVKKLSPEHQQNLEAWKTQIFKNCSAADVFNPEYSRTTDVKSIDISLFLKANADSLIFTENGNLAIVTGVKEYAGLSGSSKISESSNVNGQIYELNAETKTENGKCTLFVNGQKIYETNLIENVNIGFAWTTDTQVKNQTYISDIIDLGKTGYSLVSAIALFDLISESLKPTELSIAMLEKKYALPKGKGEDYFKLRNAGFNFSIRVDKDPATTWTGDSDGDKKLIASKATLQNYINGNSHLLLEIRLGLPQVSIGTITNKADQGSYKINSDILVTKENEKLNLNVHNLQFIGLQSFTQSEALDCLYTRVLALSSFVRLEQQIYPGFNDAIGSCEVLYPELEKTAYSSGTMKTLIPLIFANVNPRKVIQYGGWKDVLIKLSIEAMEQGKNVRLEIDPNLKTLIVPEISDYFNVITKELETAKELISEKKALYFMALDWAFAGKNIQAVKLADIIQTLNRSINPFRISTLKLIAGLGYLDNMAEYDAQLAFIRSIDDNYKAEARKALSLATEMNYRFFESDVFALVIQNRTSISDLRAWTQRLEIVKPEIQKVPKLDLVRDLLIYASIMGLKRGDVTGAELPGIYDILNNIFDPFVVSTKNFISANLTASFKDSKETLEWAKTLTPEYKKLALEMLENSKKMDHQRWGQDRFDKVLQDKPTLETMKSWNNLWLAALAFNEREKARGSMPNTSARWNFNHILDVAIEEIWSTQEFTGLEKISELAKFKPICDRHTDASSLANCGNQSLFSKDPERFFDPKFNNRYVDLSQQFIGYMNQIAKEDYRNTRSRLNSAFWGFTVVWSKCSATHFQTKAALLKTQVAELAATTDSHKIWNLDLKIQATLDDCTSN